MDLPRHPGEDDVGLPTAANRRSIAIVAGVVALLVVMITLHLIRRHRWLRA